MKPRLDPEGAFQPGAEFLACDFLKSELFEVRIVELRVQKDITAIDQAGDEMNQRNL
jgi:hypothetical protein